jgi:hypothetical protein
LSGTNFTAQLSHIINGVTFTLQKPGSVLVTFTRSLDFFEWQEFNDTLNQMIKKEYHEWVFNLVELRKPTSIDIGMWLTCNAKLTNQSGSLGFIVKRNSNVQKVLNVTKLDQIFSINFT